MAQSFLPSSPQILLILLMKLLVKLPSLKIYTYKPQTISFSKSSSESFYLFIMLLAARLKADHISHKLRNVISPTPLSFTCMCHPELNK